MNIKLIFKHYWKFLKKYTLSQVLILVFFGLGSLLTTVAVPLVYKEIIDTVSINPSNAFEILKNLLFYLIILTIIYNICYRLADYLLVNMQSKILKELYDYCFESLQKHSYSFFSNAFVGGLIAKTKRFVVAFEHLQDQFIFQIWMNGISLLSSLIVLWYHSFILGLAFFSWLIFYTIIVKFLVKWQIPKSLARAKSDSYTTANYTDKLSNILTIKAFGTEKRELKHFKEISSEEEKNRREAWMRQVFYNGLIQGSIIALFNIIIIWVSINLWNQGIITAGTIVLVQVYILMSFNIVWSISKNIVKISESLTNADEMVKILEKKPSVKNIENPKKLSITRGEIIFKNVFFSYENNKIFEKLNLHIKPGEKIALVGYSGAGKTTIVKLLLRFLDINSGSITIDGQDITQVHQEELREQIAYVPQDPALFHRTIKENIAYARPSATLKEIIAVAKKAHAHEFIELLFKKYDSLVGERGIKLSGGERQRIAIARAIRKNSPIVILDEATSSLDSISEKKIQKALEELVKNRTTIIIAHRLSTIQKMDRIIVFEEGKIMEMGTHKELITKSGLYSKLWETQSLGFS